MPSFSHSPQLLWLCALLEWFDHAVLAALATEHAGLLDAFLASELVVEVEQPLRAYRLPDDLRARCLVQMRLEQPLIELTLQTRIFEYFLQRMAENGDTARQQSTERACFAHLWALGLLLGEYLHWAELARYAAEARAAQPQLPEHVLQLDYYTAYLAIRTGELKQGEAQLKHLDNRSDLAPHLRAAVLIGRGHARWYQGDFDGALRFYQLAQAAIDHAGESVLLAQATIAQSMVYNEIGDHQKGLLLAHTSLQIARRSHNRYREAHALYEVGNNALYLGRWDEAQLHAQAAIQLYEQLQVQARLSMLYWMQGFLDHLRGNDDASEACYRHTLDLIAAGANQYEITLQLDTWLNLGLLYQSQSLWDDALAAYERALALKQAPEYPQRLALAYYRCGDVFERQGRLARAYTAYETAIQHIEQMRERTQTEEVKIGLLGTVQQVYEAMVQLCLRRGRRDKAFAYVERARSRAFLDMLNNRSAAPHEVTTDTGLLTKIAQQPATLADVQRQLPADALLLEYFTTGVMPRGESFIAKIPASNARLRQHLTQPAQTLIFAISRDSFDVFDAKENPNRLRPHRGDPVPTERLLEANLLPELYQHLIAPAEALIAQCQMLYLIPHGPLHYVPFMALHAPEGAALLRTNGPAIALAPSATILLQSCLSRPRKRASGCLALGYNDSSAAQLRYAEPEARHVAQLAGGMVWAGPAPKSTDLLTHGPHVGWLHIAGHAAYDPHDPLGSALYLGLGDTLSARQIIAQLELNADLVTLSACTSGVTHVVPGDELLGLQRAFLFAGAPAVVCALWETNDLVALLVMEGFYTRLLAGIPPAAALRDAQVAVRSLTGAALQATLDRWRASDPALAEALQHLPAVPDEVRALHLYAEPRYWATFMLIGRGD